MSLIATALKHMLASGMDHDAIVDAVAAMDDARPAGSDPVADKRRAWDRERKRKSGGNPVEPVESAEAPPSPSLPPQTPPTHPLAPPDITTRARGFAEFWSAYSNKVGKRDAEKAYCSALKRISGPDPPAVILAGVIRAQASRKWLDGIIPNPATWLNQDRWEDQPSEVVSLQPRKAHERAHPDAKFDAKQANYARAWEGSERAARFRGEP